MILRLHVFSLVSPTLFVRSVCLLYGLPQSSQLFLAWSFIPCVHLPISMCIYILNVWHVKWNFDRFEINRPSIYRIVCLHATFIYYGIPSHSFQSQLNWIYQILSRSLSVCISSFIAYFYIAWDPYSISFVLHDYAHAAAKDYYWKKKHTHRTDKKLRRRITFANRQSMLCFQSD